MEKGEMRKREDERARNGDGQKKMSGLCFG